MLLFDSLVLPVCTEANMSYFSTLQKLDGGDLKRDRITPKKTAGKNDPVRMTLRKNNEHVFIASFCCSHHYCYHCIYQLHPLCLWFIHHHPVIVWNFVSIFTAALYRMRWYTDLVQNKLQLCFSTCLQVLDAWNHTWLSFCAVDMYNSQIMWPNIVLIG